MPVLTGPFYSFQPTWPLVQAHWAHCCLHAKGPSQVRGVSLKKTLYIEQGLGVGPAPAILLYSPLRTMLPLSSPVPVNAKPGGPDVPLVSFACDSFHFQLRTKTPYPFSVDPNVISSKTLLQWATLILNSSHHSHGKSHHSKFSQGVWLGEGRGLRAKESQDDETIHHKTIYTNQSSDHCLPLSYCLSTINKLILRIE